MNDEILVRVGDRCTNFAKQQEPVVDRQPLLIAILGNRFSE